MTFKDRFKSALFSFFKKEILDCVNFNTVGTTSVQYVSNELKFTKINSEIYIREDESRAYRGVVPIEHLYEKALHSCKEKLFEEAMKFIEIDNGSVMDSNLYGGRRIKVSLFIGKSKS